MAEFDLAKSQKRLGQLYPVLLDKHGNIIDGFHRKAADPNWKEAVVDTIDTEADRIIALIHANWHRRAVSKEEKARYLIRLCELNPQWEGHYIQELHKALEFTERYIRELLPGKFKKTQMARDLRKSVPQTEFKYEWNVWEAEPERPEGYGDASFEGNTPPLLARDTLLRYTKEKDLVYDAMSGSGTVLDLCRELGRECVARDIAPMRPDIEKGDARDTKFPDGYFDFIFAHFPYWDMYVYSKWDLKWQGVQVKTLQPGGRIPVESWSVIEKRKVGWVGVSPPHCSYSIDT